MKTPITPARRTIPATVSPAIKPGSGDGGTIGVDVMRVVVVVEVVVVGVGGTTTRWISNKHERAT